MPSYLGRGIYNATERVRALANDLRRIPGLKFNITVSVDDDDAIVIEQSDDWGQHGGDEPSTRS